VEYLVPKPSGDTVTYFADWSKQLEQSDLIKTFTLTVSSGTVTISADPEPPLNFGTFIRFGVAGGADGETAILRNTVTTVGGQVMSRDIQLKILDTAVPVTPATNTKRQILNLTFQAMGLADYEFNVTPEEYASGLFAMDAQMATWRTSNLYLNYNAPAVIGGGDLDDPSGIPDDAVLPVSFALAFPVAAAIGKTLSPAALVTAGQSMNALRARYSVVPQRALQKGTPRGAGQKPYGVWQPFGFSGTSDPAGWNSGQ
jgi:hypothetical protein